MNRPPNRALELSITHALPCPAKSARDRKSTRLNSSHGYISYAVFCLKKKKKNRIQSLTIIPTPLSLCLKCCTSHAQTGCHQPPDIRQLRVRKLTTLQIPALIIFSIPM